MGNPFDDLRKQLAERQRDEEKNRLRLRNRFFGDAVRAAKGEHVEITDYIEDALRTKAISDVELQEVPNCAKRLVDAFRRSLQVAELQKEVDVAEDEWLAWQERMKSEREELSMRRRAAQVAFQTAFGASKEMAAIRREYPELAAFELSIQPEPKRNRAKPQGSA